jgi:hypothetical protein
MYNTTNTCVKINNQRTEFIKSEIGGRHGDNLSPCLDVDKRTTSSAYIRMFNA